MPTPDAVIAGSTMALAFLTAVLVVTTIYYAVATERLRKVSQHQLTLDRFKVFRELCELDHNLIDEDHLLDEATMAILTRLRADIQPRDAHTEIVYDRLVISWKDLLQSIPTEKHWPMINGIRTAPRPSTGWGRVIDRITSRF